MRALTRIWPLAAALLVTACSHAFRTDYPAPLDPAVSRNWTVQRVDVHVPSDLVVSEVNTYIPRADIVWHGDPAGDRKPQVGRIVQDGFTLGTRGLHGPQPVILDVVVQRFHAVTPITVARAPAAVHSLRFTVQVRDGISGAPLTQRMELEADMPAMTGARAAQAEARGDTQKVQISRHLAETVAGWLGTGRDNRREFRSPGM